MDKILNEYAVDVLSVNFRLIIPLFWLQVIRCLRVEKSQVPKDYDADFKKAEWTFLYQLVFDPRSQQQVRLNSLTDDIDPKELEFAGMYPS